MPSISKILVPTDFSDDSRRALSYAEEFARKFGAEIILLHADQPLSPVIVDPQYGTSLDMETIDRFAEEQRLRAQRELDQLTSRLREGKIKARGMLRVGAPFLEILNVAQSEPVDLIVMATHGRTGLAHVLMGSVAERVVRKAACPVLTVRHPDRRFKHPLDE